MTTFCAVLPMLARRASESKGTGVVLTVTSMIPWWPPANAPGGAGPCRKMGLVEQHRGGPQAMGVQRTLGINGLGRIGKLVLWYHLGRDDFDRLVVNVGRPVGTSLEAVVQYIAKASTYGPLHRYLNGHSGVRDIKVIDEAAGTIRAHGKEIVILRDVRNPKDIPWRDCGANLVVECTGKF